MMIIEKEPRARSNAKRRRIGLFANELRSPNPRGIVRTARAFAEQFAARPDLECYCLGPVVPRSATLRFETTPLAPWLAQFGIHSNPTALGRLESFAIRWVPPAFAPKVGKVYRWALNRLAAARNRRNEIGPAINTASLDHQADNPSQGTASLQAFDAVFGFDPANELLRLNISTDDPFIGCIYDFIPARLDCPFLPPQRFMGQISRVVHASRKLMCISEFTQSELREFFGEEAAAKSLVVPLGHDRERFRQPHPGIDNRTLLGKIKFPVNLPYVIILGAMEERKNIDRSLLACAAARRNGAGPFGVILVGEDCAASRFRESIQTAQRDLPVVVSGYRSDEEVAVLLKHARALLFASLMEGYGLPILEAFSAGTLAITSRASSMPEVGGIHAFYCDPTSTDDIAATVATVLQLPAEERAHRVAAGAEYAAKFTWEAAADRLLSHVLPDNNSESSPLVKPLITSR